MMFEQIRAAVREWFSTAVTPGFVHVQEAPSRPRAESETPQVGPRRNEDITELRSDGTAGQVQGGREGSKPTHVVAFERIQGDEWQAHSRLLSERLGTAQKEIKNLQTAYAMAHDSLEMWKECARLNQERYIRAEKALESITTSVENIRGWAGRIASTGETVAQLSDEIRALLTEKAKRRTKKR